MTNYAQDNVATATAAFVEAQDNYNALLEQTKTATVRIVQQALKTALAEASFTIRSTEHTLTRYEAALEVYNTREAAEQLEQVKLETAATLLRGELATLVTMHPGMEMVQDRRRIAVTHGEYTITIFIEDKGNHRVSFPYQSQAKDRRAKKAKTIANAINTEFRHLEARAKQKQERADEGDLLLEQVQAIMPDAIADSKYIHHGGRGNRGYSVSFVAVRKELGSTYGGNMLRVNGGNPEDGFNCIVDAKLTAEQLLAVMAIVNQDKE